MSKIYRNAALGFTGADFLNMVVGLETDDSPEQIQGEIAAIHQRIGRRPVTAKYSSRPLDIDLLLYEDRIYDEPGLQLPLRDVLQYSFVLRPLADLAPSLVTPVTRHSIRYPWAAYHTASHPLTPVDFIRYSTLCPTPA